VNQGWLLSGFLCVVLGVFWALQIQWPLAGIWLLVLVIVTIGMGHGALDALLLVGQFRPLSKAMFIGAIYLVVTVGAGWLFSLSFPIALIALLLMSVWHFGEDYRSTVICRIAVGGGSVMAPALLQPEALSELLQSVTSQGFTWLMDIWTGLAWSWVVVIIMLILFTLGASRGKAAFGQYRAHAVSRAYAEIVIVVSLNLVLTPIFQFALFFGAYHCVLHIVRVQRAAEHHQGLPVGQAAWAWVISMAVVMILMAILWLWLRGSGFQAIQVTAQGLHWLVVVLAAVTLPHLFLVSYSQHWLDR
jgi:Brp/Blh family beta-carotene 15,15'-monooxygenase